jgi:hypothetical protein
MLAVGPDELLFKAVRYLEEVVQVCAGCLFGPTELTRG